MIYDIRAYSFRPTHTTRHVDFLARGLSLWHVLPLRNKREMVVVERIGYYFKREMHYDLLPYSAKCCSIHNQAYLFAEDQRLNCNNPKVNIFHAVGAAGFSGSDSGPHVLEWVWLHPYLRKLGILRSAWPTFENKHSAFAIRGPLSPSMESFLGKITSEQAHEVHN